MVAQTLIEEMVEAVRQDPQQKNNTHSAVVSHVDDEGIVWVNVAGSEIETPTASSSAEVKRGDAVMVEWRNDQLYIAGNYSNPSAGVTRVMAVENEATRARVAADAAVESAQVANEAASAAQQSAADAETAAGKAQTSADNAQASANNASEYAARALGNLSTVQSVTETLNWITAHGTMTLTTDTALDPTHVYFVQDSNGDYTVGGVKYAVVTEPSIDDIADYYVLSIDESLNNYVATHLALLNDGLYVMVDNSEWKVKIANNGVFILDPNNVPANSMMANKSVIGYMEQMHVEVDTDSLEIFDDDGDSVASFGATGAIIGVREKPGDTNVIIEKDGFEVWGKQIYSPFADYSVAQIKSVKTQVTAQAINRGSRTTWSIELPSSLIQDTIITVRASGGGTDFNINFTAGVAETKSRISYDGDKTISHEADQQVPTITYQYAQYSIDLGEAIPIFVFGTRGKALVGRRSGTFGYVLNASQENQFVIGRYNDNKTNTAFEIGNGSALLMENRSNALTVDWTGNIEIALSTTAAAGTTDGDLYAAITALGWESEVID